MNSNNPWWLPKGSIRAIFAGAFIGATIYTAIQTEVPQALATLTGVIVTYYFKTREEGK